jgi:signal transduction histidine kinase
VGVIEVCRNGVALSSAERAEPTPAVDDPRFLRGLVEGMRCGILAVDRQSRVVMINEPGRQMLDLDGAPEPGTPIGEALPSQPQLARLLSESFDMVNLPNRAELDLEMHGHRGKTIGFTVSMIPGEDDEPAGAAIFFKDLTRIEHKEEQERLKDRLAVLGRMAASLAHEIRNPLASIEVTCSLLKRRLGAESAEAELLDKINAEVRRLTQTISSSLEFVRPMALDLEYAELLPLLYAAITVATERRGGPGIRLETAFSDSIPRFLMDAVQLRQVFENLILNALEAVGGCGHVRVEAGVQPAPSAMSVPYRAPTTRSADPWHRFEQFAVVRVADDGPGVPEAERDKIFYPFFTTKKQGSGVGLSIVRKIVNSHQGLIDYETGPEGGALFTVRIPMVLETVEG